MFTTTRQITTVGTEKTEIVEEKTFKKVKLPKVTDKRYEGIEILTEATTFSKGEKFLKLQVRGKMAYLFPAGGGKQIRVPLNLGSIYQRMVAEDLGVPIDMRKTTGNRVKRG